jgi:uncharacterized protein YrrD
MNSFNSGGGLAGRPVQDPQGAKVGTVADVLFDDDVSSEPSWVVVGHGLFNLRKTLVPLQDAYSAEDGALVVAFDRDVVRHGPKASSDRPTALEWQAANRHYGLAS